MSHTARRTLNERNGKTIVVVCGECGRSTVHEILADVSSNDESYGGDVQVWESYLVVQCRGCLTLSFCKESQCSEDLDPEDDEGLLTRRDLFPGRIAGRPPTGRCLSSAVGAPENLYRSPIGAHARSAYPGRNWYSGNS